MLKRVLDEVGRLENAMKKQLPFRDIYKTIKEDRLCRYEKYNHDVFSNLRDAKNRLRHLINFRQ